MTRKPRVDYQGGLYHVIVRCSHRTYIFKNRKNKEEYKKAYQNLKGYQMSENSILKNLKSIQM